MQAVWLDSLPRIRDRDNQVARPANGFLEACLQRNRPLGSELHGIIQQVDENLAETRGVANDHIRHLWINLHGEGKALLLCPQANDLLAIGQYFPDNKRMPVDLQFVGIGPPQVQ